MSQFIVARIKALDKRANALAHGLAQGAKSHDDYLLGVGRYRETMRLREEYEAMLKQADEPEDVGGEELDLTDQTEEPPTRRPAAVSRVRARSWGGGGG